MYSNFNFNYNSNPNTFINHITDISISKYSNFILNNTNNNTNNINNDNMINIINVDIFGNTIINHINIDNIYCKTHKGYSYIININNYYFKILYWVYKIYSNQFNIYYFKRLYNTYNIYSNSNEIDYIMNVYKYNPEYISWYHLSKNTNLKAIKLLEKNIDKIHWNILSMNPYAIHIIEANIEKIDWSLLSGNPSAIHLLKAYPDKIDWINLSKNTNPIAIQILEENPTKIDWCNLSKNPSAIHLLEQNKHKINLYKLQINPAIFKDTYSSYAIQYFKDFIFPELIAFIWHPSKIHTFNNLGFNINE